MRKLRVLDLFSGIGGLSLGLERTGGFETVAFCEIDSYASKVLQKWWPHVPNFSHGIVGLNALLKRVRTSSPLAFHARTYHSLARVPDLPEPVRDLSGRYYEPFAWYDHEARCWRTWQRCLVEGWTLFSGTWPRSGMTRNGIAYRRAPLAPLTDETASGYCLPTPTATSYGSNQGGAMGRTGPVRHSLQSMAKRDLWPTPTSTLGSHAGRVTPNKAREGGTLVEAVAARTWWPTPDASAHKYRLQGNSQQSKSLRGTLGGDLNPTWVEWLMGYPLGWTGLEVLATPSSRKSPSSSAKRSSQPRTSRHKHKIQRG